jgi:hypothetical protein
MLRALFRFMADFHEKFSLRNKDKTFPTQSAVENGDPQVMNTRDKSADDKVQN